MTGSTLLTMKEVADILHCSKAHVCNAIHGKLDGCTPIPAIRLGRRLLVRVESLEQWVRENEAPSATIKTVSERGRKSA